eukprot:2096247-Rhodomonas_salina.1
MASSPPKTPATAREVALNRNDVASARSSPPQLFQLNHNNAAMGFNGHGMNPPQPNLSAAGARPTHSPVSHASPHLLYDVQS